MNNNNICDDLVVSTTINDIINHDDYDNQLLTSNNYTNRQSN